MWATSTFGDNQWLSRNSSTLSEEYFLGPLYFRNLIFPRAPKTTLLNFYEELSALLDVTHMPHMQLQTTRCSCPALYSPFMLYVPEGRMEASGDFPR